MRIPALVQVPVIALTLMYAGDVLGPQAAQAHHNAVHSTEQAVTKAVSHTSATIKQVAVKPASKDVAVHTPVSLPLTMGGAALLSLVGLGVYKARKQQSA